MSDTQHNLHDLADLLSALAHAARLQILMVVLVHGGTMSAGSIAARFSHRWPTTSRHLRVLEQAGLLEFEKLGRTRVFRVNRDRLNLLRDWLRWFDRPPVEAAVPIPVRPADVLREIALAYPEAHEERAEGKSVFKVRSRPFLLLEPHGTDLHLLVRLQESRGLALAEAFVQPVRYRFGKSDWIEAAFRPDDDIPLERLWEWIDESYRSVAPRALLEALPAPLPAARAPRSRKSK